MRIGVLRSSAVTCSPAFRPVAVTRTVPPRSTVVVDTEAEGATGDAVGCTVG